jgi:hypothetical protein
MLSLIGNLRRMGPNDDRQLFLSGVRGAAAGEDRPERAWQAGTMAPFAMACAGTLRGVPPRKLTAPLDIASAAFTVSFSTRRSTVTCCSALLPGCFRTAAAPRTQHFSHDASNCRCLPVLQTDTRHSCLHYRKIHLSWRLPPWSGPESGSCLAGTDSANTYSRGRRPLTHSGAGVLNTLSCTLRCCGFGCAAAAWS